MNSNYSNDRGPRYLRKLQYPLTSMKKTLIFIQTILKYAFTIFLFLRRSLIATVGDASPRQAQGHIGDNCVKWKDFLSNVPDVADQTGTVRGRIERVEMKLKPGLNMIVRVIASICCRWIGDSSPMCRSRSPTVTIIWKPFISFIVF